MKYLYQLGINKTRKCNVGTASVIHWVALNYCSVSSSTDEVRSKTRKCNCFLLKQL